jgi:hypothetical protein
MVKKDFLISCSTELEAMIAEFKATYNRFPSFGKTIHGLKERASSKGMEA